MLRKALALQFEIWITKVCIGSPYALRIEVYRLPIVDIGIYSP